ncbi:unnamed protein product [Ceutorhynchus assimilis]|uniref:C2H2-type domain-containing protein n=1 Tax=Ceutorhynchus assimilis TaxID=467358 RepID=A0A9N9MF54_9CUCU|nr:unnamed protein product [Ceutorhynchus assimilis]
MTTVFACPRCNKIYHHKKTLSRHIRQECGIEPVLKCPHCPYRARRTYVLNNHIKGHQYLYNNSTWVKIENNPDKVYLDDAKPIENLLNDMENDTEHSWMIQVIYPEDSNNTLLYENDIVLTLQDQKDLLPVTDCDESPRSDKEISATNEQVISIDETQDDPTDDNIEIIRTDEFTCPNCLKTYNAKRNLQRHLRVECGKEPQYSCKFCEYKNYRRNELLNHMKKRHSFILSPDEKE